MMKSRALLILLLLGALAVALRAPAAYASDAYEKYIEWYSDATMTEVVGWRQEYCGGTIDAWGYQTAYRQSWNGERCVDGGGGWGTWCSLPYDYACPAQCAFCTYS